MIQSYKEPVKLSKVEDDYADRAFSAGVTSLLEVVHVLVLWRITQSSNIPDPDWIQRQFTILKVEVQKAFSAGGSLITPGVYIPKHARSDFGLGRIDPKPEKEEE